MFKKYWKLEKSGNFVNPKKWEPCVKVTINLGNLEKYPVHLENLEKSIQMKL